MAKVISENIVINLTPLISLSGRLIEGVPIELEFISLFKHKHTDDYNLCNKFTDKVLYHLYGETKKYNRNDVYKFIPKGKYEHTIINFKNSLDILILNKIKPNFLDVVFIKFIKKTDTEITAEFRVEYLKRG